VLKKPERGICSSSYGRPCLVASGVDEPERSGTPFRYLLFSRNARSGTYCQISRNVFYLPFRHLFTEMMNVNLWRPLFYLQPVAESWTGARFIVTSFIFGANKIPYSSN